MNTAASMTHPVIRDMRESSLIPFEWLTLLPSEYSHAGWPVVVKKRRGITFLIDKLHFQRIPFQVSEFHHESGRGKISYFAVHKAFHVYFRSLQGYASIRRYRNCVAEHGKAVGHLVQTGERFHRSPNEHHFLGPNTPAKRE